MCKAQEGSSLQAREALGEDDLQQHVVFRFADLMESWEWAHALPKLADVVFPNFWGWHLGVGVSHDPITPVTWFDALIQSIEGKYHCHSHTNSCLSDSFPHTAAQSHWCN